MPVTPSPQKNFHYSVNSTQCKDEEVYQTRGGRAAIFKQMNSRARGDMTAQMIDLGYTPTSKSTLRRLMQRKDAGKEVANSPWVVTHQNKAKPK